MSINDNMPFVNATNNGLKKGAFECNQPEQDLFEEICFQQSKRNMGDLIGKTIQVSGWFVRFGHTNASFDDDDVTILVKRPYTLGPNKEFINLSSHIWIKYSHEFKKLKLRHGDKFTFFAQVSCYQKKSGQLDFSLIDVNRPMLLYRNCEGNTMRIFEQEIPFLKETLCFVSLKSSKVRLFQKPIKLNGEKIKPGSSQSAPVFEIKLKDVNQNAFRFLFRLKGTAKWCRYAYFFPKLGARLFLDCDGKLCRLSIPDENYYALKDAYHLFLYSGEFKMPVNGNTIHKLRIADTDPQLVDMAWPTKRCLSVI